MMAPSWHIQYVTLRALMSMMTLVTMMTMMTMMTMINNDGAQLAHTICDPDGLDEHDDPGDNDDHDQR